MSLFKKKTIIKNFKGGKSRQLSTAKSFLHSYQFYSTSKYFNMIIYSRDIYKGPNKLGPRISRTLGSGLGCLCPGPVLYACTKIKCTYTLHVMSSYKKQIYHVILYFDFLNFVRAFFIIKKYLIGLKLMNFKLGEKILSLEYFFIYYNIFQFNLPRMWEEDVQS